MSWDFLHGLGCTFTAHGDVHYPSSLVVQTSAPRPAAEASRLIEALRLVAAGLSNAEIAASLVVSNATVSGAPCRAGRRRRGRW